MTDGFVVHSLKGWPFLRKLAPGAIQWTECVSMAQKYGTREEAEAEAFTANVRWSLIYNLEVITVAEALALEKPFAERVKLAW